MAQVAADWILTNGRILTFNRGAPRVEALAIRGERIVAAGSDSEVRRWRGRGSRVVDLQGATVIPGLVDAHAHLDREGLKHLYPLLASCRSVADIQTQAEPASSSTPMTRRPTWLVRVSLLAMTSASTPL
jgi:predicted amidohydrolase YtcJ